MFKNKVLIKKILIISSAIFAVIAASLIFAYLVLVPALIKSNFLKFHAKSAVKNILKMDLEYEKPYLKTYLNKNIDFKIDKLSIKKDNENLVELNNVDVSINFNKIFKHQIKLNRLLAKTLVIKADKLLEAMPEMKQEEQKPVDFKVDFYDAQIGLDYLELSYMQPNKTIFDLYMRDISLECEKEYKNLGFNLEANITKNNVNYANIVASSVDEIKIFDDKLTIENLNTLVNDSKLKVNSRIDLNSVFINAVSDKFYLTDVFQLIKSDFVIPDGETLLLPLNSPSGFVSFNVNLNNDVIDGVINVNNTAAKLKDLSNIPLNIQQGKIVINKEKIDFRDLTGYWGKNKKNKITIYGNIKDYYKTFDSNITVDTVIANEFFHDYLAKLIGVKLYVSKPSGTRIIYCAKNNIMDITWLAKIAKGVNFGVDNSKSALSNYDRAVKGDFHIEGDRLDIKNINYYIASDIRKGVKIEPILVLDAKMDLAGKLDEIGFAFAREMPCEFLNVFIGDSLFKKGTIKGDLHVAFKDNVPYLDADMTIKNTFIPSQRVAIKDAVLKTNSDSINFDVKGRFKRIGYVFCGKIKNRLEAPFVIKNLALDLDNIDVERFLASLNNSQTPQNQPKTASNSEEIADDDFMFDTNLIRIENGRFSLQKGNYKDLTFGNINANISLNEKGILDIQSNKFDIAEGISTLKVKCDLKNLKYYLRLGVKEINSDLMAKVLFNLDKEITGKASGLIELTGDESMKLNGDIKFLVHDGTIGKIGLVEYVLKIASVFRNPIVMVSPATIMDIVSIPEGKFDKITGELKIKDNVVHGINIKSESATLSALIRGVFDMERHDTSLRIYTRFSTDKKSVFGFLRNVSLNSLANKVQMTTRNDANYYESELVDLPQIEAPESKTQIFLTQVEGDVEHNNFLSSLKKIK